MLLSDTISRTKDAITSELDGEVVMMSIEHGEYYGLGKVGSVIWSLIDKPITLQQVVEHCTRHYEVDIEQCKQDIILFLSQLHQKGLISYSS